MNQPGFIKTLRISAFLFSFSIPTFALATSYDPGFVWNRNNDFSNGIYVNSTAGNPNTDQSGNPAWSYEYFTGNDYTNTLPMKWSGWRWAVERYKTQVNISEWDFNTHLNSNWNNYDYVSLVRWVNPSDESIAIDMTGNLRVHWYGMDVNPDYLIGSPVDVQLIVGKYDQSSDSIDLLINNAIGYPYADFDAIQSCMPPNYTDCAYVDTLLNFSFQMDQGDSLFWTAIPLQDVPGMNRWITTNDHTVEITVAQPVPEPSTLLLFGSGLVCFAIKRLRNRSTPNTL